MRTTGHRGRPPLEVVAPDLLLRRRHRRHHGQDEHRAMSLVVLVTDRGIVTVGVVEDDRFGVSNNHLVRKALSRHRLQHQHRRSGTVAATVEVSSVAAANIVIVIATVPVVVTVPSEGRSRMPAA